MKNRIRVWFAVLVHLLADYERGRGAT